MDFKEFCTNHKNFKYLLTAGQSSIYKWEDKIVKLYYDCLDQTREIKIANYLKEKQIKGIAEIYGPIKDSKNNTIGILMKYYPKGTLENISKQIDTELKIKIYKEISHTIKNMHKENILHNDIKLSNILIDEDYKPYICNFMSSTIGESEEQPGTYSYYNKDRFIICTKETDKHALNMMLLYLITDWKINFESEEETETFIEYLNQTEARRIFNNQKPEGNKELQKILERSKTHILNNIKMEKRIQELENMQENLINNILKQCSWETRLQPFRGKNSKRDIHRIGDMVVLIANKEHEEYSEIIRRDFNARKSMETVRRHTSIPVPNIIAYNENIMIQEYIKGIPLLYATWEGKAPKDIKNQIEEIEDQLKKIPQTDGKYFAHGDLTPTNIIVNENKIVGIIDWEMSGYQ